MAREPEVVRIARQYRRLLRQRETAAVRRMVREYRQITDGVLAEARAMRLVVEGMREAGQAVPLWRVMELQRYQDLMTRLNGELAQFNGLAAAEIEALQAEAVRLGGEMVAAQMDAQYDELAKYLRRFGYDLDAPGVQALLAGFHRPPVAAMETMVGFLGDGSPLAALLAELGDVTAQQVGETLTRALALGWNPRKTARVLRSQGGLSLTRALRIARTEQLRAFRRSSIDNYRQHADVLSGYRRKAAKNSRTCLACLLKDGEFYELVDDFTDHPNGRCTVLPVTKGWAELGFPDIPEVPSSWPTGREWFMDQGQATQRKIMGDPLFKAWQAGEIELDDALHLHQSRRWGDHWGVASLTKAKEIRAKRSVTVSLSEQLRKYENEIRHNRTYETAYVFDRSGNMLFSKIGTSQSVKFNPKETKLLLDAILTHNHPITFEGASFSKMDIRTAINKGMSEIRAVGGKYGYRVKIPSGVSDYSEIQSLIEKVDLQLFRKYNTMVISRTITIDQADLMHRHELWQTVFDQLGWLYERWEF